MQTFMSFYEGQLKQRLCYSFLLPISHMVLFKVGRSKPTPLVNMPKSGQYESEWSILSGRLKSLSGRFSGELIY